MPKGVGVWTGYDPPTRVGVWGGAEFFFDFEMTFLGTTFIVEITRRKLAQGVVDLTGEGACTFAPWLWPCCEDRTLQ